MGNSRKSAFWSGAGLVWRRQSVLWWIFAVNFILAAFGTRPFTNSMGAVLDHSLHAQALVNGFNLMDFISLLQRPQDATPTASAAAFFLALVFFIFMLFVEGGLLELYRRDWKLTRGEFFGACGRFFWRFVRLLVLMLIVLVPVGILAALVNKWSDAIDAAHANPKPGSWFLLAGFVVVLFLMQVVRLWIDMAQIHAVAGDQHAMLRCLARAFKLTFGNFGSLYWLYLRISIVAWLILAALVWVWMLHVKPQSIGTSFVITQLIAISWLGTRLWQRASETLWYQQHPPALVAAPAIVAPEPELVAVEEVPIPPAEEPPPAPPETPPTTEPPAAESTP